MGSVLLKRSTKKHRLVYRIFETEVRSCFQMLS